MAGLLSVVLCSSVLTANAWAANVEETPGLQLQTILIDNDGKNWTTESWGGATMTPNTNWTTLNMQDYYEHGMLHFAVKNNGTGTTTFRIGLVSHHHNQTIKIEWSSLEQYGKLNAETNWTAYSLPIKTLVDAYPDSDFRLDNFWYVYVGGVSSDTTLSFQNVKITSTDDERQYPMIKVNQVGYFSNGAKTARVSYFEKFGSLDGKTYEIVDAEQGDVVATGTLPTAQKEETLSGEMVHTISFDAVTEPGSYYIRIPDAGLDASARSPQDVADGLDTDTILSPTFSIENHVYDALFSDMTKYFYYQRQGIDLEETYAGVFARENLHPNDVTVKKWSDRDNPNAETYDVSGGWYDAGDYGKYVSPAAGTVEDLLLAYELFPDTFNNMDLNIPETDPNNARYVDAPGMLSELKWELDMLLKLEHSDKDGSFYVAANYKDDVIYLEDTLRSTDTYQSDDSAKDLRSHLATADAAAIFAHAYLVYREIPAYADFADTCLETALRAWNWVTDPSNPKHMSIGAANRTYTFTQEEFDRDLFWAAGSLYRAVKTAGGDVSPYENYLLANCNTDTVQNCFKNISLSYNHAGESFLGFFHYLYQNEQPNAAMTAAFSNFTPWRTNMLQHNNWGMVFPNWGYWWGSNRNVAQNAMTLLLGSVIMEGQDHIPTAVSEAADHAFDYLLGDNPISFSYVSGYGERSVENIYSKIYSVDAALTPYQVPKGYVTEGTNYHNNRHLSKFDGKCYMDSDTEYTTNENTIYGNASALFLTAAVIAGHTKPEPDTVQGDVNADGTFDLADVVMLQKWLIRAGTLTDWTAGDWNDDETITVVDLCLMKRALNTPKTLERIFLESELLLAHNRWSTD